jgi:nicotinamidase-related amidase
VELLNRENTGFLIIDVQEKLMEVMRRKQGIMENIIKLLHLTELFKLPLILTEQYPRWLGPTLREIQELLPTYDPITKMHFNCCDVDAFNERLEGERLQSVIVTGVESHICVFQTCACLLQRGYAVHVPQDAVDSRTEDNWRVGLELLREAGAFISSTETVIYQIMGKAGTKEFKKMLKILK